MNPSLIIGGASDDHDRNEMDFYPTPPDCTMALMRFLKLKRSDTVWECACGNGMMSNTLIKYVDEVISTDVRENTGFGEGGVDFLTSEKRADIVITNPPFDVANKFIIKCHTMDLNLYCMLLKSQYWHAKNRLSLFNKTRPSYILPLTWRPNFAFTRGSSPLMDMAWTVWVRGESKCQYVPLDKDPAPINNLFF